MTKNRDFYERIIAKSRACAAGPGWAARWRNDEFQKRISETIYDSLKESIIPPPEQTVNTNPLIAKYEELYGKKSTNRQV